jgi:MYXO-CTERM domain-containing protein
MKRALVFAVVSASAVFLALGAGSASAESRTIVPDQGGSINEDTAPAVLLERPRTERLWIDVDPAAMALPAVNTNKIFLNNCKPNGCVIRPGNASSIDGSGFQGTWQISSQRTLTAFAASDTVWNGVVSCVKEVFAPFGVEIVTTNPSPAPHFEIMIAGRPQDVGMSAGIGGISPFSCQDYIPNSLVFDFAGVYGNDIEEMCATAAQEIAHSFALDHVIDPSDPLTYYPYSGRRHFKDAQVQCGSDCQGGVSPFGDPCSGLNQQSHVCSCPNSSGTILQNTQNSVATITRLFGSGTPTPPTVRIVDPTLGASVSPGFPVHAEITDDIAVGMAELRVDGVLVTTLTQQPWVFNAPQTLADGTHTVEVTGYDTFGSAAKASVQVVIGMRCGKPADCPKDTDTCIGGRCVPGPGAQGGLGQVCTVGPDCASGQCASDSSGKKYCVEACTLDAGECPENFGCLKAGDGGVCWPGYDDGTGGCSSGSQGSATGAVTLGLAFAATLFARRRRRR